MQIRASVDSRVVLNVSDGVTVGVVFDESRVVPSCTEDVRCCLHLPASQTELCAVTARTDRLVIFAVFPSGRLLLLLLPGRRRPLRRLRPLLRPLPRVLLRVRGRLRGAVPGRARVGRRAVLRLRAVHALRLGRAVLVHLGARVRAAPRRRLHSGQ